MSALPLHRAEKIVAHACRDDINYLRSAREVTTMATKKKAAKKKAAPKRKKKATKKKRA